MNSKRKAELEALGVLSSSIAHDLNNVLTGVLGHVSFLRVAFKKNDLAEDSLVAIEDGAKRAAAMVSQILEFARGEALVKSRVDLSYLVQSSINLILASVSDEVKICFDKPSTSVCINGNESKLTQVILNLLVNAKDAVRDKNGKIVIELKSGELHENEAASLGIHAGNYVMLSVADNGCGIAEEVRQEIFKPFFTTKERRGTGLGLSTVYSVVKEHSGEIFCESEEGRGSIFVIYFPLEEVLAAPELLEEKESDSQTLPSGTEKILVVDDEQDVRTIIQRCLEHLGYEVLVASNGKEAIELFSKNFSNLSLIILDMIMPDCSGDELFMKFKKINNDVTVLLSTGYASDERIEIVLKNGGKGVLRKPFAVDELALEVRRCIDNG